MELDERFGKVELKLSEHDEKLIAHDRSLSAIRNLLQTGIRMLVDMEVKMSALIDSDVRLRGRMEELAEAQRRTEESLRRFLDRSGNGRSA
jgi:hypothetical protein